MKSQPFPMSIADDTPTSSARQRVRPNPASPVSAKSRSALPGLCALAAVFLTGCAQLANGSAGATVPIPPSQPDAAVPAPPAQPLPAPVAEIRAAAPVEPTLRMLAYADRLRQMQPAELTQEIARLGDVKTPQEQLQLSLALSQLRQLPELVKAQELLARVIGNPDGAALHPLARLLSSRYAEIRRFEEQIDKQAQQIRDTQRKLDQTNERLEALKAIERSLVNRQPNTPAVKTPVAPVTPAQAVGGSRSRSTTPRTTP